MLVSVRWCVEALVTAFAVCLGVPVSAQVHSWDHVCLCVPGEEGWLCVLFS